MLVALVIQAQPAALRAAEPPSIELIEPRVERLTYVDLLERLGATADERLILDFMYSDYAAAVQDLAADVDARAEAAGRQTVTDALSGRRFLDPAELRELRLAVQRVYAGAWSEADALIADLLDGTRSIIDRDERQWSQALLGFRRAIHLHPRRAGASDESYAGHGVDVLELVSAAQAPGGELERVDAAALAEPLEAYARDVDAHLVRSAAADRRGRHEETIARIQRDDGARRAAEEASLERWRQLYRINEQAVQRIGLLAERSGGAEARARWRLRFDEACFPWLYRRTRADQVHAWILGRRLPEDVSGRASAFHGEYEHGRRELLREASGVVLRARLDHQVALTARMGPAELGSAAVRDLYQQLLRNSGRRKQIEDEAVASMEALLTEGQRDQMRADLAAAVHGRRR